MKFRVDVIEQDGARHPGAVRHDTLDAALAAVLEMNNAVDSHGDPVWVGVTIEISPVMSRTN